MRTNLAGLITSFANAINDTEALLDQVETDMASARTVINTQNVGGDVAGKYAQLGSVQVESAKQRVAHAQVYVDKLKVNMGYLDISKVGLETAAHDIAEANADIALATKCLDSCVMITQNASEYIKVTDQNVNAASKALDVAKEITNNAAQQIPLANGYIDAATKCTANAAEITANAIQYATAAKGYAEAAAGEIQTSAQYLSQAQSYSNQAEQYINSGKLVDSYKAWANKKWDEYQKKLNGIGKIKVFGSYSTGQ